MRTNASAFGRFRGCITIIGKIIQKIFDYLSGYEGEAYDNRALLRRLHNTGYLDDGKYEDLCQKCANNNFDPEELPM